MRIKSLTGTNGTFDGANQVSDIIHPGHNLAGLNFWGIGTHTTGGLLLYASPLANPDSPITNPEQWETIASCSSTNNLSFPVTADSNGTLVPVPTFAGFTSLIVVSESNFSGSVDAYIETRHAAV